MNPPMDPVSEGLGVVGRKSGPRYSGVFCAEAYTLGPSILSLVGDWTASSPSPINFFLKQWCFSDAPSVYSPIVSVGGRVGYGAGGTFAVCCVLKTVVPLVLLQQSVGRVYLW